MRKYELTYLVSDDVPESDLNKVTGKVAGVVEELGGKIAKEDIWGRRKLAYPIKKQDFATYVTIYLDLPAERAIEFEKDLRHIDGIVRQLMIVKDYGAEELTLTAQEVAETKEIEEVIGGEKSFEAVEGMTSESRELMSVREGETAPTLRSESRHEIVGKESRTLMAKREIAEAEKKEEKLVEDEEKEIKEISEKVEEAKKAEPETGEEIKEEKPIKKPKEKKLVKVEKKKTEKSEKPKKTPAKKKSSAAKATADEKVSDEVERLSKLNEELDDILKDEL